MTRRTRLIAALDTRDDTLATAWSRMLAPHVDAFKLGLEFTCAHGLPAARRVAGSRALFLDLKLHDIPNTVAGAIHALAPVAPEMLTVHAQGGEAMIAAARAACEEAWLTAARPLLLAVTVLTSLDAAMLHQTGVAGGPRQQVLRLGRLAIAAGADGLICSPQEIALLREALGDRPVLVVPGVRPPGAPLDDQRRTLTPAAAREAGADWVVVGRPITRDAEPARAAAAIAAELA